MLPIALLVMLAMVLVASLPGAAVLVVAWFRHTRPSERNQAPLREGAAHA
jgi:hypothetical protein